MTTIQLLFHLFPRPFGWLSLSTHSSSSKCFGNLFFVFAPPKINLLSYKTSPPKRNETLTFPGSSPEPAGNRSQREVIPDCEAFVEISEESLVDKSETKVVFLAFLAPRLQGRVGRVGHRWLPETLWVGWLVLLIRRCKSLGKRGNVRKRGFIFLTFVSNEQTKCIQNVEQQKSILIFLASFLVRATKSCILGMMMKIQPLNQSHTSKPMTSVF